MIHSITMQVLTTNSAKPTKHFLGGKTKQQISSRRNRTKYTYDNLHRLTASDRAFSSQSLPNEYIDYEFNQLGNITKKDDYFSTASYGNAARNLGGNAGPNAIRQVTYVGGGTTSFTYDNNGNMLTGDGRTLAYNEFNKPTTITKGGVTSTISYGADLLRYKHIKTGLAGGTQTTYNIDRHLEVEKQGSRTTYRHYIDGVAVLNKEVNGSTTWTLGFNLKDRLGSVVTLADHNGNVLEHRSYDPFGKPRRGDFIDASVGTIQAAIAEDPHPEHDSDPMTDRGFTDHEHLDEQRIIHMNGRVYSYDIGRFTSVDPFIQNPTSSQSLNPYSYIMNNPLAGTDPSGYASRLKSATDVQGARWQRAIKNTPGTASMPRAKKYFLRITTTWTDAGDNGGEGPGLSDQARSTYRSGSSDGVYQNNAAFPIWDSVPSSDRRGTNTADSFQEAFLQSLSAGRSIRRNADLARRRVVDNPLLRRGNIADSDIGGLIYEEEGGLFLPPSDPGLPKTKLADITRFRFPARLDMYYNQGGFNTFIGEELSFATNNIPIHDENIRAAIINLKTGTIPFDVQNYYESFSRLIDAPVFVDNGKSVFRVSAGGCTTVSGVAGWGCGGSDNH